MTDGSNRPIPVSSPDLDGNEERYVLEALRSTWISSTGPFVARFEQEFADACETSHAVPVANGTVALHVALVALDVRPGDEVIVPSLTYIATANAVKYVGAEPVFVDVTRDTWCIDPDAIEAAITDRTKGIIAVDLYGHPADIDPINAIAAKHGLWVIEDAAEAHLARYKGRRAGSLSTLATFSFYGNKIFTSGEGGAITTNDDGLAARVRLYRGQGVDPERRYWFPVIGYNYRLTNIACAILCAQMERADQIVSRREAIFRRYEAGLSGIPGIGLQPQAAWAEPARWLFCITVAEKEFGRSRDDLMSALQRADIDTRPFFHPLHRLPPYAESSASRGVDLPITDALSEAGMNLPTYSTMDLEDVDRVCESIRAAART